MTNLTKAEVAIQYLSCRTPDCGAKPTEQCRCACCGAAHDTHPERLADAAVWFGGYSVGVEEVAAWVLKHDEVQAQLQIAKAQIKALTEKPFLFGAAYGGNSDPALLEKEAGVSLGISVTYWDLNTIDNAIKRAKVDHAAGRRSWLSFKFGTTWTGVIAGKVDVQLTNLAKQLRDLDFEVWVSFHHEPEGDEPDMGKYVAAQRHALGTMPRNVMRWLSLTGWTNLYGGNVAFDPEKLWPGDDVCDGISFDPYNEYASHDHPTGEKYWTDLVPYFDYLQAFAKKHNCMWAIRETGLTDTAVASAHVGAKTWIIDTATKAKERGGAAFCYFASDLNLKPGDIVGIDKSPAKRADFINAMRKFAPVVAGV